MSKKTNDGDVAFVSALAELLREHDLSELEVTRDFSEDDSITVRPRSARRCCTRRR